MNKFFSSVFFHELKNSLSSIKFSVQMLDKYDVSAQEKKETVDNIISTITNTTNILEEYMDFIKFKFTKKLKYEEINLYELLSEIKNELLPQAEQKSVNIYIQKSDIKIISNKFWLKRAIYNVVLNAIKYNKRGGSVNIKIERDIFGIYISISDTGVGIKKKNLSSIFKMFKQIDDTKSGAGIGLALANSVITSFGGQVNVKSNEDIGTEFILYVPKRPKEITIKRIALGLIPASIALFLSISYFPIYSQKYDKSMQGGYVIYTFEDGSVLKYSQNSDYEIKAYKNLYNTKYTLSTTLKSGDMSLKAIKNKASIYVNDREFNNLGTDFEIIRDDFTKVAVFEGSIKSDDLQLNKGEGSVISAKKIKVVELLTPPRNINIKDGYLTFNKVNNAKKYKIIISRDRNFNQIEDSFFTNKTKLNLEFKNDALYYVKIFAYDKYGLPSLPSVKKYINLSHYKKAMKIIDIDMNDSILELETSISTIQNHSSLPYYELAKILFFKKQYKKALALIQKAIKTKEKKEYYYLLLDIYEKLNKTQEIEKTLNKVLKIYPNDIYLLFYKAKILFLKAKYKEATKLLFKILQQRPNFKEANSLMAKTLMKLHKNSEAKYYERLAK